MSAHRDPVIVRRRCSKSLVTPTSRQVQPRFAASCAGQVGPSQRNNHGANSPWRTLRAEFLEPLSNSEYRLAKEIGVLPACINEIVHGNRSIAADTALRLARYFDTSPQFWMNLQNHYDLEVKIEAIGSALAGIAPLLGPNQHQCRTLGLALSSRTEWCSNSALHLGRFRASVSYSFAMSTKRE